MWARPLIPGGVLLVMAIPRTENVFEYVWSHWQLILVVIGVLILVGAFAKRGE